jgi:hypothetical protein
MNVGILCKLCPAQLASMTQGLLIFIAAFWHFIQQCFASPKFAAWRLHTFATRCCSLFVPIIASQVFSNTKQPFVLYDFLGGYCRIIATTAHVASSPLE